MSDDVLGKLSFDEAEYELGESRIKYGKKTRSSLIDYRICACGHPMSRHKENPFIKDLPGVSHPHNCAPANAYCSCKSPRAILEAPNTKRFLMKAIDTGSSGHPLTRAIAKLKIEHEDEYNQLKWLDVIKCDKCDKEDVVVSPVGFDLRSQKLVTKNQAGDVTIFLCDDCRYPTSENVVIDSASDD